MALKTTLEKLTEVQAAITKTLAGQSGTWDGKQLTMADLSTLRAYESELLKDYAVEQGTGGISRNRGRILRG